MDKVYRDLLIARMKNPSNPFILYPVEPLKEEHMGIHVSGKPEWLEAKKHLHSQPQMLILIVKKLNRGPGSFDYHNEYQVRDSRYGGLLAIFFDLHVAKRFSQDYLDATRDELVPPHIHVEEHKLCWCCGNECACDC